MSEQDRRECWSCGSANVWVEDWNGPIYIKCHGCKVRIGPYADEPTAIAAWNQRAGCASCRDEAIAAALAVEQRNYDQAQEIKALRKLREAAQYVCDCWQIDSDNEHAVVPFGPASMLQDMLAAWDGGSVCMGQDIGGRG